MFSIEGLTDQEVLINSMIFMVAGYDTTATTLCWLAYDLATNPDIQERLIEEIDSEIGQVCHVHYLNNLIIKVGESCTLEKSADFHYFQL